MSKLILHIDGSEVVRKNDRTRFSGWSVISLHGDELHETSGCMSSDRNDPLSGYHEQIAFVNGVLYAHDKGFDFKNVNIFCDDECFGNGPSYLHMENYRAVQSERLMDRLAHVVKHCFEPRALALTLQAFDQCMITKVKGHSHHVYQERADCLAKFAATQKSQNEENKLALPFEDWLKQGIPYCKVVDGVRVFDTWFAPFVEVKKENK